MNGDMAGVVGAGGVFLFLIVVVWQIAATWRARMLAAREDQYKRLAAKYAELLEDNVELHRRTLEELAQTRSSVTQMEKMMRSID
ncbi:hypothetical protein [Actinacidiphila glaucinigra]|uniref:Secreted protein n=1 Tax=Actinacidiphila glaucinigra TaxID=235986 RepID=A0A239NI21_9ACTN|nr:hypothetical protein [Actinacidiphila glaucinigra]WSD63838.1 hypothetical protein OIE69_35585 [Actinacidiphila glaucinigra]SNT53978.1 hypothetical protein SAMN05216252_13617 [Actinacidiphila glaucinigra]